MYVPKVGDKIRVDFTKCPGVSAIVLEGIVHLLDRGRCHIKNVTPIVGKWSMSKANFRTNMHGVVVTPAYSQPTFVNMMREIQKKT